jgi:hypothetical protein
LPSFSSRIFSAPSSPCRASARTSCGSMKPHHGHDRAHCAGKSPRRGPPGAPAARRRAPTCRRSAAGGPARGGAPAPTAAPPRAPPEGPPTCGNLEELPTVPDARVDDLLVELVRRSGPSRVNRRAVFSPSRTCRSSSAGPPGPPRPPPPSRPPHRPVERPAPPESGAPPRELRRLRPPRPRPPPNKLARCSRRPISEGVSPSRRSTTRSRAFFRSFRNLSLFAAACGRAGRPGVRPQGGACGSREQRRDQAKQASDLSLFFFGGWSRLPWNLRNRGSGPVARGVQDDTAAGGALPRGTGAPRKRSR